MLSYIAKYDLLSIFCLYLLVLILILSFFLLLILLNLVSKLYTIVKDNHYNKLPFCLQQPNSLFELNIPMGIR